MQSTKILKTISLASILATTLVASDKIYFIEGKYSALDGQAKSYVNTAHETTKSQSVSFGKTIYSDKYRIYGNYSPIRWEDAKADILTINLDYLKPLDNTKYTIYTGFGIGGLKYQGDPLKDTDTNMIATLQAGITYDITDRFYISGGVRYIYTNNTKIEDNQFLWSELDNMLGGEIGIGVRF